MRLLRQLIPRFFAFFPGPLGQKLLLVVSLGLSGIFLWRLNLTQPLSTWMFFPVLLLWGLCGYFTLGATSLGYAVVQRLQGQRKEPLLETLVLSFVVGLTGFCFLMYGLGATGLFRPWIAVGLPLVLSLPGLVPLGRRLLDERRTREKPAYSWFSVAAVALGTLGTLIVYLQAFAPDAINFDAAWYHIPTAETYARKGRIVPFYSDFNRGFPHLASFVYTWGLLLPGLKPVTQWMLCLHLEFTCFLWTLAGVAAAARYMLGDKPVPGSWAAFFLSPAIFVYDQNLGGAADHVLATFAAPAFLAGARAFEGLDWKRYALVGIVVGGAILTKYQGVYWVAGAGVLIAGSLLRGAWQIVRHHPERPSLRALLLPPLALTTVVLLLTAPHFLKNAIFYRNPFYPFAYDAFPTFPRHPKSSLYVQQIYVENTLTPQGNLLQKIYQALEICFTFSFRPHYSFTNNWLIMGSLFTLLTPFPLFLKNSRRLQIGFLSTFAALFTWSFTYYVDRYLQAIVPMMGAVVATIIVKAYQDGLWTRLAVMPLLLIQLVWGADIPVIEGFWRIQNTVNIVTRSYRGDPTILDRFRAPYLQIKEAIPEDAKVLFFSERKSVGIDRDLVYDSPNMQGLVYYGDIESVHQLWEYYKKLGITHLLLQVPCAFEHTKRAEVLVADLFQNYGKNLTVAGPFRLVELPDTPPPEKDEYRVLSLGTVYPPGVYDLSQLGYFEKLLPQFQEPLEQPLQPLDPTDLVKMRAALFQADAVILGPGATLPSQLGPLFGRMYTEVLSFWTAHRVLIRNRKR